MLVRLPDRNEGLGRCLGPLVRYQDPANITRGEDSVPFLCSKRQVLPRLADVGRSSTAQR